MSLPTVRCEYAPGFSPLNLPGGGDWVSLGTRVVSWSSSRGRQDALGVMEGGTATAVLDGSAGDLDPLVSGSLFYGSNGIPGTPFRIIVTNSGTDYTQFTGFMWPDGPSPSSARGSHAMEVTVQAVDYIGWAASHPMPSCEWSSWLAALASVSEVYLRGQANYDSSNDPALVGSYKVFNFGTSAIYGTGTGTPLISAQSSIISLLPHTRLARINC